MGQIDVEITEGVKILRMNRPEKKNALTDKMYHTLADEMIADDAPDDVRGIVLLGAGGNFTTGNDIGDFLQQSMSGRPTGETGVARFLKQQVVGTIPLIAGVEGLAIGVGATTLFQCDLVYAAENADIRTPFLDLGVVAENASSYLAPRIMGYQKAFEMLCLGEPFTAQMAYEAGFVNRVVPVKDLEESAISAAKRLAAKPPEALAITRALLRSDTDARATASATESRHFGERLQSDEARAAFSAFMSRKAG